MSELIRLERAEIGYTRPLLPPLTLAIQGGQRLAVLGPNGSGKSTLLRTLIGLLPPLAGQRALPLGRPPRIGYLPQTHRADPVFPLDAAQVVLQGRYRLIGTGRFVRKSDRAAALQCLERVGMGAFAHQPYRSLSGGQRQRVLLARALCAEPELLVLDEFTSELDPAGSSALHREVSALAKERGACVLFVTHEIADAAAHSTEVVLLDTRSGLFEQGPTAELLTGERLSKLYGQSIHVERRGERMVVFVEAEESL